MVFLTSVHNVHQITEKNIVAATVGLVFLIMRSDVKNPRLVTSEPEENFFGCMRTIQREFTIKGFCELSGRVEKKMRAISSSKLLTSRDKR